MSEIPEHPRPRRLAHWINPTGAMKVHSLIDKVYQRKNLEVAWEKVRANFGLAQTPRVWRELDRGLRHRLRAIQLRQWRHGTTIYRELRALGASLAVARQVAANSRRWWRNSGLLNSVLTVAWFDRLGLPRLS
jgi:RNA-directed DNA polymerase